MYAKRQPTTVMEPIGVEWRLTGVSSTSAAGRSAAGSTPDAGTGKGLPLPPSSDRPYRQSGGTGSARYQWLSGTNSSSSSRGPSRPLSATSARPSGPIVVSIDRQKTSATSTAPSSTSSVTNSHLPMSASTAAVGRNTTSSSSSKATSVDSWTGRPRTAPTRRTPATVLLDKPEVVSGSSNPNARPGTSGCEVGQRKPGVGDNASHTSGSTSGPGSSSRSRYPWSPSSVGPSGRSVATQPPTHKHRIQVQVQVQDQDRDQGRLPDMPARHDSSCTTRRDSNGLNDAGKIRLSCEQPRVEVDSPRMNSNGSADNSSPSSSAASCNRPSDGIRDDAILPPPDLFSNHLVESASYPADMAVALDEDLDGDVFLLPPPEEFNVDTAEAADWPPPPPPPLLPRVEEIGNENGDDVIVLPPPELFDNCAFESFNDSETSVESRTQDVLENSLTDESLLGDVITKEINAARQRLASDAMDKLDALCKNVQQEATPTATSPSASNTTSRLTTTTYTPIPVYHETTAPGPAATAPTSTSSVGSNSVAQSGYQRRGGSGGGGRAVVDSWPSGLFLRDQRQAVSVDDPPKRHSADTTSLQQLLMEAGGRVQAAAARPKVLSSTDGSCSSLSSSSSSSRRQDKTSPTSDMCQTPSSKSTTRRRMFSRYRDEGRDMMVTGNEETSSVIVGSRASTTALRHKSLEPVDFQLTVKERGEHSTGRTTVRSEGDLRQAPSPVSVKSIDLLLSNITSGASADNEAAALETDRMCSAERMTTASKTAVRKNLLEQAAERRREMQLSGAQTNAAGISPSVATSSVPLSTLMKGLTQNGKDAHNLGEVPSNTATVEERKDLSVSSSPSFDGLSKLQRPSSSDGFQPAVDAGDAGRLGHASEICLQAVPVSGATASIANLETSKTAINRRLRTERSMETMPVPRPASIILPSASFKSSASGLVDQPDRSRTASSSPIVEGDQVRSENEASSSLREVVSDIQRTRSNSSRDVSDNGSADVKPVVKSSSLPPVAPLFVHEPYLDVTAGMSGRNTPSTGSAVTFPDGSSMSNFGLSSPDSAATGSSAGQSGTPAQQPDRHFIVVAIDFGTTFSGYAFSFVRDPDSVHMMRRWEGGDPGVVNQKTPTTILLEPNGKFHSFGYAARDFYHDLDAQEAKRWLYFEKFKMALHYNKELNKETTIKAANGKPFLALTVFAHALKFFYEHALQELSDQSATTIVNEDIRWVITVPAIWKAPAKQFMRYAAYQAGIASPETPNQLLIALEPEAASIYVRRLRLYQLVPEPPYVGALKREPTPDPSLSFEQRSSDDEFSTEESIKYRTLPAVHLSPPSSTTVTVGHEVDIEGTRYMVVDCGGGTVDITVYEMESRYGCLKELHKATGGPYGSVGVDLEFERLLVAIFGAEFIDTFKMKRPAGWVDLMSAFESRKRTASPFKNTPLNVALPFSFIDYHKKCRIGSIEAAVKKYGSREVVWSSQGMLRLTVEAMRRLFQPTLDRIKQSIGDVLNHPNARDIRYMFLVGGFAESPMLQLEMRKEFSHLLKIIIPQDVALTILKGAVIFGIDPTVVGVRRSRLTYGVGVLHRFDPDKHVPSKKITRDGTAWCTDIFDKFVTVDQEVAVGDVVVRSYAPARPGQRSTVIHIYCTDRTDILYVTDNGVRRCGTLCLDLTETMYVDPDSSTLSASSSSSTSSLRSGKKKQRREIQARMTFGDTEIRVDAVDIATGRSVRAGIDFLNK